MKKNSLIPVYLLSVFILAGNIYAEAIAKDIEVSAKRISYSPNIDQTYPSNVYWGDTHLHTNLSVDANGMGNKSLSPDDAYRFAKGEAVTAHNGMKARLQRPLDFLVIADHAINMGVMRGARSGDPALLITEIGRRWYESMQANTDTESQDFFWKSWSKETPQVIRESTFRRAIWQEVTAKADEYNQPGQFTAFIGYEWTPSETNHHRVVIFKDDAGKADQVLPFSGYDSWDPEKLWSYLSDYETKTGGGVLAIPHNSNLTNGLMFSLKDYHGRPLNKAYAKMRSRWEPLVEATQIKGDSETHPILSPTDEFADYETWNGWKGRQTGKTLSEESVRQKPYEYVRSALKLGLQQHAKLGVNPFKFGLIGSTDSHTSLATGEEDNFWGKMSKDEPSPERLKITTLPWTPENLGWEYAASGYAAVWAEENTRESLFAAMKRKETYATTGPRMSVRFFGGWEYEARDAQKPDLARIGYSKGVPMGGDLTYAPKGKSPTFLIRAVKDPDGANLDRIQVIKGWHDKNGELHEKIYNVALSDSREPNWRGKIQPVGNTVDVKDASYTNSIGDPELNVVWSDPNFNQDELAFYYVRVIEIPTPRWTAYDAKFFSVTDIPEEVPMVTQERAYTSPIWYEP